MKTMDSNNKLTVGFVFYPEKEARLDLERIYRKIEKLEKWKIDHLFENLEIQLSFHNDNVIIEDYGGVFYHRKFDEQIVSSKELKSMWDEVIKLINELNLDVKYENEIDISIHAKNPQEVYERNKQSIEEFGQNLLRNFSLSVISGKASAFATVTPVPETIPFKVLG
jgi:hypothetical protein